MLKRSSLHLFCSFVYTRQCGPRAKNFFLINFHNNIWKFLKVGELLINIDEKIKVCSD